jgi:hypothetical protein
MRPSTAESSAFSSRDFASSARPISCSAFAASSQRPFCKAMSKRTAYSSARVRAFAAGVGAA